MNETLEEKINTVGDYFLTNQKNFKHQLELLLKPIGNSNGEELSKELFNTLFNNLYVKILYIDVNSLDFICCNKIVKMEFTKSLFNDISSTPKSDELFKIEPPQDKRVKSIFYLNTILNFTTFTVLDFKCLKSMKIFDNKETEITDIYYGGLFKIIEDMGKKNNRKKEEFIPLEEQARQENNRSLFTRDTVSQSETKTIENEKLITEYHTQRSGHFSLEQNVTPEFRQKCINVINLIYNVDIKEVKFEGAVSTRRCRNLYNICILNDGELDYVITSTFDGEISTMVMVGDDVDSILRTSFDYFIKLREK